MGYVNALHIVGDNIDVDNDIWQESQTIPETTFCLSL